MQQLLTHSCCSQEEVLVPWSCLGWGWIRGWTLPHQLAQDGACPMNSWHLAAVLLGSVLEEKAAGCHQTSNQHIHQVGNCGIKALNSTYTSNEDHSHRLPRELCSCFGWRIAQEYVQRESCFFPKESSPEHTQSYF